MSQSPAGPTEAIPTLPYAQRPLPTGMDWVVRFLGVCIIVMGASFALAQAAGLARQWLAFGGPGGLLAVVPLALLGFALRSLPPLLVGWGMLRLMRWAFPCAMALSVLDLLYTHLWTPLTSPSRDLLWAVLFPREALTTAIHLMILLSIYRRAQVRGVFAHSRPQVTAFLGYRPPGLVIDSGGGVVSGVSEPTPAAPLHRRHTSFFCREDPPWR